MGKLNDEAVARLTAEQRAELERMRAESATPGARAEEARLREAAEAEFPAKDVAAAATKG